MTKNKDNKPYTYPKEATPEQVGEMAKKFEEMRQMSGSDGRYDKPKPKKKVMEPIEIPEILSVPRYSNPGLRDMSHTNFGRLGHTKVPESYNKGPETPVGLSKRFTQERLHEGKILKQLDKDMANDERNRKNNKTTIGGDNDR